MYIYLQGARVLEREKERNTHPASEGQEEKGESGGLLCNHHCQSQSGIPCILGTATQNWDRHGGVRFALKLIMERRTAGEAERGSQVRRAMADSYAFLKLLLVTCRLVSPVHLLPKGSSLRRADTYTHGCPPRAKAGFLAGTAG